MTISPEWVHEPEAAKLLAIKPSTLRNMHRKRRLDARSHWVDTTSPLFGRCSVNALLKRCKKMMLQLELRKQAVDSYDDGRGIDQLITEVQS